MVSLWSKPLPNSLVLICGLMTVGCSAPGVPVTYTKSNCPEIKNGYVVCWNKLASDQVSEIRLPPKSTFVVASDADAITLLVKKEQSFWAHPRDVISISDRHEKIRVFLRREKDRIDVGSLGSHSIDGVGSLSAAFHCVVPPSVRVTFFEVDSESKPSKEDRPDVLPADASQVAKSIPANELWYETTPEYVSGTWDKIKEESATR